MAEMEKMDEIDRLRRASAQAGKRALFRWCVRWTLTGLLIAWLFPKHPVLWWSLVLLVPLGLGSLAAILMLFRTVPARCDELERRMDGS